MDTHRDGVDSMVVDIGFASMHGHFLEGTDGRRSEGILAVEGRRHHYYLIIVDFGSRHDEVGVSNLSW